MCSKSSLIIRPYKKYVTTKGTTAVWICKEKSCNMHGLQKLVLGGGPDFSLKNMHIQDTDRLHMFYTSVNTPAVVEKCKHSCQQLTDGFMIRGVVETQERWRQGLWDPTHRIPKQLTERWRHWWGGALRVTAVPEKKKHAGIRKQTILQSVISVRKLQKRRPTHPQPRVFFSTTAVTCRL